MNPTFFFFLFHLFCAFFFFQQPFVRRLSVHVFFIPLHFLLSIRSLLFTNSYSSFLSLFPSRHAGDFCLFVDDCKALGQLSFFLPAQFFLAPHKKKSA